MIMKRFLKFLIAIAAIYFCFTFVHFGDRNCIIAKDYSSIKYNGNTYVPVSINPKGVAFDVTVCEKAYVVGESLISSMLWRDIVRGKRQRFAPDAFFRL